MSISKLIKYEKGELIGTGTYSLVYKCTNNSNKRTYAMKMLSASKMADSELMIHNKMDHPNIVSLIDVIYERQTIYLIEEYCPDGNLSIFLGDTCLPIEEIRHYFRQLVEILRYLHEMMIVHRDIKPQNIVMKGTQIKLTDFGYSREYYEEDDQFTDICGSPCYIAPEIKRNEKYNNTCDIWSVGIILYQMMFGMTKMFDDAQTGYGRIHADQQLNRLIRGMLEKEVDRMCISDIDDVLGVVQTKPQSDDIFFMDFF
jgi:serine/threonine-protein kinase ULK/ATG1